jgi:K+-transporting ATPase KdpF subunit
MTWLHVVSGITAALILIYLVYALLRAEDF